MVGSSPEGGFEHARGAARRSARFLGFFGVSRASVRGVLGGPRSVTADFGGLWVKGASAHPVVLRRSGFWHPVSGFGRLGGGGSSCGGDFGCCFGGAGADSRDSVLCWS